MSDNHKIEVDQSEPNLLALSLTLILSSLFLAVIVYWSIIFFKSEVSQAVNQKQITRITSERQRLALYEDETLNNYHWVDKKMGLVRIPIQSAMRQVVDSY
eukprot:SAG22_NODE_11717_length_472_cov_1.075067_2_plen_101_part_00